MGAFLESFEFLFLTPLNIAQGVDPRAFWCILYGLTLLTCISAFTDAYRGMRMPDWIPASVAIFGILSSPVLHEHPIRNLLIGTGVALALFIIGLFGIGLGDTKLAGSLALVLGSAGVFVFIMTVFANGLGVLGLFVQKKMRGEQLTGKTAMPMGPYFPVGMFALLHALDAPSREVLALAIFYVGLMFFGLVEPHLREMPTVQRFIRDPLASEAEYLRLIAGRRVLTSADGINWTAVEEGPFVSPSTMDYMLHKEIGLEGQMQLAADGAYTMSRSFEDANGLQREVDLTFTEGYATVIDVRLHTQ